MISPITQITNHFSNVTVNTAFCAAVGFFGSRLVQHLRPTLMLDPHVGLACGVATGIITGLFMAKDSNKASVVVGLAALAIVPIKICQRFNIPTTLKMTLVITSAVLITRLIADFIIPPSDS